MVGISKSFILDVPIRTTSGEVRCQMGPNVSKHVLQY